MITKTQSKPIATTAPESIDDIYRRSSLFVDRYGNELPSRPRTEGEHQKTLLALAKSGQRVKVRETRFASFQRARVMAEAESRLCGLHVEYTSKYRNGSPIFDVYHSAGSGYEVEEA